MFDLGMSTSTLLSFFMGPWSLDEESKPFWASWMDPFHMQCGCIMKLTWVKYTHLEYNVSLSRYVMQLPLFMLGTEYDNLVAKYWLAGWEWSFVSPKVKPWVHLLWTFWAVRNMWWFDNKQIKTTWAHKNERSMKFVIDGVHVNVLWMLEMKIVDDV